MVVESHRDAAETRARLGEWLAERLGVDRVGVGELTVPGLSGYSNETLIFDATWDAGDGPRTEGLVVRVEPSEGGHRVFPSTAFDEQVRVIEALNAEGSVPVPRVVAFEQDTTVLGARFLAMGRVDGQAAADNPSYHDQGWLAELPAEAQQRVWWNGVEAIAAVHRLDREAAGLGWVDVKAPADLIAADRAYAEWAGEGRPVPGCAEAFELLEATMPPSAERPTLCWGDSRLGNILFDDLQRVAAVLDWEMLLAGDPVQDLAWYLVIDRHHHEGFGVPRLAALPGRDETAARWSELTGRSTENLGWYELLGAVRFAAIMTRVMLLLERDGLFPGASALAFDHGASRLVYAMLDERA
jgi:aminoglycoside phosphotransferase (APT) family kinase protein